jgi:ATP-dependent DNA helicase RecQ
MILFLDLEVDIATQKVKEIGLVQGERYYKGRDQSKIREFAQGAKWICGHNLLGHDLPMLKRMGLADRLNRLEPIDTLLLSPLLRPDLKRHKLAKDYLVNDLSKADPLYDAELARDLLYDLGDLWQGLPHNIREGFRSILGQQVGFRGFFEWLSWEKGAVPSTVQEPLALRSSFWGYSKLICANANLETIQQSHPVELAYVLALVKTEEPKITTPSWILGNFPSIQQVFDQLRAASCGDANCHYCTHNLQPVEALKAFFGYEGFRTFAGDQGMPLQEKVVRSALRDESLLAIFPTGGGKSLAFQLPALVRGKAQGSLTVVISPLVSLMKDQVDVLFHRFHRNEAVALNGMLSPPERQEVIERVEDGTASLLYLSPESLRSATVLRLLSNRIIDRFVIDEAHCFSAWGQDFRVDYEFIGPYIRMLQERKMDKRRIPVSCFTATARPEVVNDIQTYFREELGQELQQFITRQTRRNLEYQVISTPNKEEKFDSLVEVLQEKEGPAIVYVTLTKTTEVLAKKLQGFQLKAGFFHGKMEANDKKAMQERFMNNELDVMVATSAFGMGVDKDNIRLVIHYEISSSLENYVQEAGRAGRDKDLQADCVVLFDQTDLSQHFNILQAARISQKEIQQIWRGIQRFKRDNITKSALEIARKAGWDEDIQGLETRVKTAVNALEKAGYVERYLNSPRVFANSILIDNFEEGRKKIEQNAFLFQEKTTDAKRVLKAIMGQSRRDGETRVDYLADSLGLAGYRVVSLINQFKEIGILGDLKDLEVAVNLVNSKNGSREIARRFLSLEELMLQKFGENSQIGNKVSVSLRELNDQISAAQPETSMDAIRRIFQIWELHGWIRKNRTNRSEFVYEVVFKKEQDAFRAYIQKKKQVALDVVKELILIAQQEKNVRSDSAEKKLVSVEFSMVLLKKKIETEGLFKTNIPLRFFERALLYLNHIGAIDMKRGFLVFFNRLNIGLKEKNVLKKYTLEDYQKMMAHYQKRIEQIHIAGEYAKRMLHNYQDALTFTSDYFELEYGDFIKKYFPGNRKEEIQRAMTPEKFEEIFSQLSLEQKKPVVDSKSPKIVVAAGPGSGKTMVLVHKMANLILMEDIHPRQLLVLAFSRPAAREFKERLVKLVGAIGYRVDIFTYHGYAFRLIGRMGNLQRAENVIQKATQAILEGEIPLEMVAAKNVIMLDEFQDVSQVEFDFLQAIRKVAGDPRVIAAGDDDQNIYEFRGSSVQFMRQLVEEEKTSTYFLTDNYRSGHHIVEFSNAFLDYLPPSRLKAETLLQSRREELGAVKIVRYAQPGLLEDFCRSIANSDCQGTIGVLTATNEEAYLVASRLRNLGIPASLVSSNKEFRLKNLVALQAFTQGLFQKMNPESGRISNEAWNQTKQELGAQFERSKDWDLVLKVINTFEREKKYKYRIDWLAYLGHARIEDFYEAEKGRVFVSTMHKIKGKQFDKVFLLQDNFRINDHAKVRVVYVAITRARNYLEIHTHLPTFDHLETPGLTSESGQQTGESLPVFTIQCSLSDVVLSHFHLPEIQSRAESLLAGEPLQFSPGIKFHRAMLADGGNNMAACFSSRFKAILDAYFEKGYEVRATKVGHAVYWWDENKGINARVVLPELELRKHKKGGKESF